MRCPQEMVAPGVAVLLMLAVVAQVTLRFAGADRGFERYTHVALPAGVRAVGHDSSAAEDPLFHAMHYWLLEGPADSLRPLAATFGMARSDEDASSMMPDMQAMFGAAIQRTDVVEGYQGSAAGGRDRWLLILSRDKGALFATP
jgi:hypothetical protein